MHRDVLGSILQNKILQVGKWKNFQNVGDVRLVWGESQSKHKAADKGNYNEGNEKFIEPCCEVDPFINS